MVDMSKSQMVLQHCIVGSNPARSMDVRVCIQKITDWFNDEINNNNNDDNNNNNNNNNKHSLRSNTKVYGCKTH